MLGAYRIDLASRFSSIVVYNTRRDNYYLFDVAYLLIRGWSLCWHVAERGLWFMWATVQFVIDTRRILFAKVHTGSVTEEASTVQYTIVYYYCGMRCVITLAMRHPRGAIANE